MASNDSFFLLPAAAERALMICEFEAQLGAAALNGKALAHEVCAPPARRSLEDKRSACVGAEPLACTPEPRKFIGGDGARGLSDRCDRRVAWTLGRNVGAYHRENETADDSCCTHPFVGGSGDHRCV